MKTTLIFLILFLTTLAQAQTKLEIVKMIRAEALKVGVDQDLAVSIAKVESSLNPKAVGGLGEQGLFQLRPEFHKIDGKVLNNIQVAVSYLKWLKEKDGGKSGQAWFVLYNSGPYRNLKQPTKTNYFKKVMNELSNIKVKRYIASN
jgi:soluble lytic murein transglycosylase-like protein